MQKVMLSTAIIALIAVTVGAAANTTTVSVGSELGVVINATAPIVPMGSSAAVQGRICLEPAGPAPRAMTSFVLDDGVKLMTDTARPQFNLDTAELADGLHYVRLDYSDGPILLASTGSIPLYVYNNSQQAMMAQAAGSSPDFIKTQRKIIRREMVWFDGREGDLEKHGFIRGGRVYITLTDLVRHIGGSIVWGPHHRYIEVHRSNMVVRVVPDSATIYVDGRKQRVDRPALRIGDRTYVAVRPMCELFEIGVDWNYRTNRAMVGLAP
jgi:hypothetical protein